VAQPLGALVVIAVTALNYLSVKFGGGIQIFLTVLKTSTILLIVIGGLFYNRYIPNDFPTSIVVVPTGFAIIGAVLTAMVPAMWAYNGFNDLGDLGEEISEPGKNIPRAIIFGLLSVMTLYLLANVMYFRVLPFTTVVQSMHVASDVVQRIAGPHGAAALTVAMAISALGALHVVILTGARIPYAMARDGVFFSFAERVHPKFRTPSGSLLFLGGVGAVLALTGTYEELYSLFVFAVWIFFALNAIAMLRLRMKQPNLNRPYRALGYPVTAIIFLVAAIALTVNLWLVRPVRSTVGLLVIAAGIPLFYRWRKTASSN
jgi:APA family basic amino acid/polyamine antiporter